MKIRDHFLTGEAFEAEACNEWDCLRTRPVPEDLEKYYNSPEYRSHLQSPKGLVDWIYMSVKSWRIKQRWKFLLKECPSPSRVLDYGCAEGSFIAKAPIGLEAYGYEPHLDSAEFARNRGLSVVSDLEELKGDFDLITLWHVLEHTIDPKETLVQLGRRLRPGALLYVVVPNLDSWDQKHYKSFWAAYDVPRHLWHFRFNSLKLLAKEAGLEISESKRHFFDLFYISYLSERYKGSSAPLLKSLVVSTGALLFKRAYAFPSAIGAVLKKPF